MKHFPAGTSATITISLSFLVISQTVLTNLTTVKGDQLSPSTDIEDGECSVEKWAKDDPYGVLVDITTSKLALDCANQPDYVYYLRYSHGGDKAVYGFSGCSTDLSQQDCTTCLGQAYEYLLSTCSFSIHGEVTIGDDCIMIYGDSPFYG